MFMEESEQFGMVWFFVVVISTHRDAYISFCSCISNFSISLKYIFVESLIRLLNSLVLIVGALIFWMVSSGLYYCFLLEDEGSC